MEILGEEESKSIKERRNISQNGHLNITVIITTQGNIHNTPIVNFMGIPILNTEEFKISIQDEIDKIAKSFSLNNKKQDENFKDALKVTCRKFTKEKDWQKTNNQYKSSKNLKECIFQNL